MASISLHFILFAILISLSLLSTTTTASSAISVSLDELDSAIAALHRHEYNLFGNSISVTDLSFRVLTSSNGAGFTFLAPPNSALFTLDMNTDAFTYIHSLRFHLIPRRFSYSDLRDLSMSSFPYLRTLAGGHNLFVSSSGGTVSVDGVRISVPDLFLRPKIAIHGLDGILVTGSEEFFEGDARSITMPPADAVSPVNEGTPALSPMVLTPGGSARTDWYDLDEEVTYPNIWPPVGSVPPSPTTELTPDPRKNQRKLQIEDEGDLTTYERSSSL